MQLYRLFINVSVLVSVQQLNFPGESGGLILPPSKWNVSEVATMAYGYGLNATVLQMVDAYAMLANKGVKMPLSLYKLDAASPW